MFSCTKRPQTNVTTPMFTGQENVLVIFPFVRFITLISALSPHSWSELSVHLRRLQSCFTNIYNFHCFSCTETFKLNGDFNLFSITKKDVLHMLWRHILLVVCLRLFSGHEFNLKIIWNDGAASVLHLCNCASSSLCVKQLKVFSLQRVSRFLRVHPHSALSRVFAEIFTAWETVLQFADTYHSASRPPTHPHPADTSCRDAAQTCSVRSAGLTVSTISMVFSSSEISHWFITLSSPYHSSCFLFLAVLTCFHCL